MSVADWHNAVGSQSFAELVAAYRQGLLCPADLAQLPTSELENLHRLGRHLLVAGDAQAAAEVLGLVVQLHPYNPDWWLTWGLALQRAERFDAALEAYLVCCTIDESQAAALVYAAECAIMAGRSDRAGRLLARAQAGALEPEALSRARRLQVMATNVQTGEKR